MTTTAKIIMIVSRFYGIEPRDIGGTRRHRTVTKARKVCAALMRDRYGMSYPEIGLYLNRHHSTIITSCRDILESKDLDLRKDYYLLNCILERA